MLREDVHDPGRSDPDRAAFQRTQAEAKAEPQQADGQWAQTLTEVQRRIAQLGTRLDELRRRVDVLKHQLDVRESGDAMSETARRVMQNSVLRVGGYAVGAALHFAVIVLAARYLGAEMFGNFALVLAIAASFQLIVDMGVRNVLIRDIAVDKARFAERLGVARPLMWALSSVTLGLIVLVANLLTLSPEVRQATYLAGVAVILTFNGLGYSAVLRAFEEMEWDILGFVLHKVVFIGLVGAVIRADAGLRGLFGAMLVANGFLYVYHRVLVRVLHGPPRLSFDLRAALRLLAESFPLGVAELLRRLTWQADKLLLAALATPVAVGLFSAPFKLLEATNPFAMNLTLPLFPAFSRFAHASPARLMQACEQSLKFLYALGMPLAVVLFVLSDRIVELFFGHGYGEAGLVLRVLAPVAVLLLPTSVYGYVFTALGRQRAYTACAAVALLTKVVVELLLIPSYVYVGAALGTLAAETVLYLGGLLMLRRVGASQERVVDRLGPRRSEPRGRFRRRQLPVLGLIWRPALAGLAMGAVCWVARELPLLLVPFGLLAAALAYVGLLLSLGTFTRQERSLLVNAMVPTPLRKRRPEVPASVERVVMQALEREPERRPRGMGVVANELNELVTELGRLKDESIRRDPAAAHGLWSGARWKLVGISGLLVAMAVPAAWMARSRAVSVSTAPPSTSQEAPATQGAPEPAAVFVSEPQAEAVEQEKVESSPAPPVKASPAEGAPPQPGKPAAAKGTPAARGEDPKVTQSSRATPAPRSDPSREEAESPDPAAIIDWLLEDYPARIRSGEVAR